MCPAKGSPNLIIARREAIPTNHKCQQRFRQLPGSSVRRSRENLGWAHANRTGNFQLGQLESRCSILTTTNLLESINVHATNGVHECLIAYLGEFWGFCRMRSSIESRGLTQVPLAELCDKLKPSVLNHSRR